jgi:hypothetical protein
MDSLIYDKIIFILIKIILFNYIKDLLNIIINVTNRLYYL